MTPIIRMIIVIATIITIIEEMINITIMVLIINNKKQ